MKKMYNKVMTTEQLIRVGKIGRFVLGFGILVGFFILLPLATNNSLVPMVVSIGTTYLVVFAVLIVMVGLHFVFSKKIRWRIDIFLLVVAVISFIQLYSNVIRGDIRGDAKLRVIVLTENQAPVPNLEVDLGEKPGQPPKGGVIETDEGGIATFFVKPGMYYIYFNMNNFPNDLQPLPQGAKRIKVNGGITNEEMIILNSK
jgi:hypothetical protein